MSEAKVYVKQIIGAYNEKFKSNYGCEVKVGEISEERYEEYYEGLKGVIKGSKQTESIIKTSRYIIGMEEFEVKGVTPKDIQKLLNVSIQEYTKDYVDLSEYGIERLEDNSEESLRKLTSTELNVYSKLLNKLVTNDYTEYKRANIEKFYEYNLAVDDLANEGVIGGYVRGVLRKHLGEARYIKKEEVRDEYNKEQQLENFKKIYGYILKKLVKEVESYKYVIKGKRELAKLYLNKGIISAISKMGSAKDAEGALGDEVRTEILSNMKAQSRGFTKVEDKIFKEEYSKGIKEVEGYVVAVLGDSSKKGIKINLMKEMDIKGVKDVREYKNIEYFKRRVKEEVVKGVKVYKGKIDAEKARLEKAISGVEKVVREILGVRYKNENGIVYGKIKEGLSILGNTPGIEIENNESGHYVLVKYKGSVFGINSDMIIEGVSRRVIYDKTGSVQQVLGESSRLKAEWVQLSEAIESIVMKYIKKKSGYSVLTNRIEVKEDQERLGRLIKLLSQQEEQLKVFGIKYKEGKLKSGEVNRLDIKVGKINLMVSPYYIYDYDNKQFIVKREKSQSCLKEFEEQIPLNKGRLGSEVDKKAINGLFKMVTYAFDMRRTIK